MEEWLVKNGLLCCLVESSECLWWFYTYIHNYNNILCRELVYVFMLLVYVQIFNVASCMFFNADFLLKQVFATIAIAD